MMLLEAYDNDISANGIKLPQCHVTPHFNCFDLEMQMSLMVISEPHDADTNAVASHDNNTYASGIM